MEQSKIWVGKSSVHRGDQEPKGEFVEIDQEKFYKISEFHRMPDFFISIVSDSDHWMFLSSNGSLTCGRKNRDNALFPYYTDDKIHDYRGQTGSRSLFLVNRNDKTFLWEPFTEASDQFYSVSRNIYKSIFGNKIIFEEINNDLKLRFRYGWANSEKFGFIKKSSLLNLNSKSIPVKVLDGIQNILPPGVDYHFQNSFSNLLDAYKKNERLEGGTLAVFTLSSIPIDRAEPSESLRATTVWSAGLEKSSKILLSENQLGQFRSGHPISDEKDIRAARGAYFIYTELDLDRKSETKWTTIAEVNQDSSDVANLNHFIHSTGELESLISADISLGTKNLEKMVASADGLQLTNTEICYARHYSNTLFNIMRGGIFAHHYRVQSRDYKTYVSHINKIVARKFQKWFDQLDEQVDYPDLLDKAAETGDPDLLRITYEYLPLIFSRRHGDPSRPWNIFSIETKNEDGTLKFNYQGNWRDIFQNWEALSWSFPGFIEGIISKFVNASTLDGYNPYRIMRDGIDWERPDPEDPWAYIGYWGDHQIIYLQKLLEISENFHPGKLDKMLKANIYTYAHVPYRIKSYEDILKNPKDTVEFDHQLDQKITRQVNEMGADAKILKDPSGKTIYKVNFSEKILATLLSKISNFIPEAGIWLNTQRPEWNDANNALVGNGTSMVTLYYLRRFLVFWIGKFSRLNNENIKISEELVSVFNEFHAFLDGNLYLLESGFTDKERKKFADFLGSVHSGYRNKVYANGFSGTKISLKSNSLKSFAEICLRYVDQSIRANRREDGLYHAYNLITLKENEISIRHLYEMLEGQVAVLSAGILNPAEHLEVLDSLKKSNMYRADQYSYMLYPDRPLARFTEKNNIPGDRILHSPLLKKLVDHQNESIIKQDLEGHCHFQSDFRNAEALSAALDKLGENAEFTALVRQEKNNVMHIYEEVFDHQSFTGRSGTFYGYEGLGSIYWHMVSKLLLAAQECFMKAVEEGATKEVIGRLKQHYYEIKAGIGLYKNPGLYGAFPMDAYSHTPGNAGVKQPGLTGQVKEDFISRMCELGIRIQDGEISFDTRLFNEEEFSAGKMIFKYYDIDGNQQRVNLSAHQIGFTFCQVPIIYRLADKQQIILVNKNGKKEKITGCKIGRETSHQIFNRSGQVARIEVSVING
jgi:hypothetical protein